MHTPEEILKILNASLNVAWNNYIGKFAPLNLPPEMVECMKLTYFDAYKTGTEFAAVFLFEAVLQSNPHPKEKIIKENASMNINNILKTLPKKERFGKN